MAFRRLATVVAIGAMLFPSAGFAGTTAAKSPPPAITGHSGPYAGLKYVGNVGGGAPGRKNCKAQHCPKKSKGSGKSTH